MPGANISKPQSLRQSPLSVRILFWLMVFLATGGLITAPLLIIAPDGSIIGMPLGIMHSGPFTNFLIPGVIMLLFLGIYPALMAWGLWKKPAWRWANAFNPFKRYHWSWVGSLAAAIIVIIWLTVELLWVGFSALLALYYVWSGLVILFALLPSARKALESA
jgi:hypothetical protein